MRKQSYTSHHAHAVHDSCTSRPYFKTFLPTLKTEKSKTNGCTRCSLTKIINLDVYFMENRNRISSRLRTKKSSKDAGSLLREITTKINLLFLVFL